MTRSLVTCSRFNRNAACVDPRRMGARLIAHRRAERARRPSRTSIRGCVGHSIAWLIAGPSAGARARACGARRSYALASAP
ncbi:hypothetical protein WS86_23780 [Burkholderia savannae]|nr:hypothetical protein WS86_23780 [Burkholderia savannae]